MKAVWQQGLGTMPKKELICQDLIVGSGMQGMMAIRACVGLGRDCILMDIGSGIGGILRPVELEDVLLDPGCHIWENEEVKNIEFFEDELGIKMIPVRGHCEISISEDGIARRKLSVPSFETLPRKLRMESAKKSNMADDHALGTLPLALIMHKSFGTPVCEKLLAIAQKMYGRDPSDLSMLAAGQMAISRIKLHTCDELDQCNEREEDLGLLLCSHSLRGKSESIIKFRYPDNGLGHLLNRYSDWISDKAQTVLLGSAPARIQFHQNAGGGTIESKDSRIQFKRLFWCCNPLALSTLLEWPLPPKSSTAGSAFRTFFFQLDSSGYPVEYSHDFRVESPMFRSWIPPREMVAESSTQYMVVECPVKRETPELVASVAHRAAEAHGLEAGQMSFMGTKSQVRFYPTVTYIQWLSNFIAECVSLHKEVLIPGIPLYGKDVITSWWERSAMDI